MCIMSIFSTIDSYDEFIRILQKILSKQFFLHWDDGSCLYKHRYTVQVTEHPQYFFAFIDQSCKEIMITSLRYPYLYFSLIQNIDLVTCDRCDHHIGSKKILVIAYSFHKRKFPDRISLFIFRIIIIHRGNQRTVLFVCQIIHSIDIRQ